VHTGLRDKDDDFAFFEDTLLKDRGVSPRFPIVLGLPLIIIRCAGHNKDIMDASQQSVSSEGSEFRCHN
jgi:hypothetical protein